MNSIQQSYANPRADAVLNTTLVWSVFLFFNFLVTYRVLLASFISDIELLIELGYIAFLLVYVAYRLAARGMAGNLRANSFEIYLGLMFFLPIIPALGAKVNFGQPIFYGLAVFRDFYLIYGTLLVYDLLRKKVISIQLVEKVFVFTAWFTLIMYYGMTFLTNPSDFQDTGLAGANDEKGGTVYYRFNMAYLFFGSIYYFVKAFYKKKPHLFVYSLFFLIYIVFIRLDRTSIAVVLAAMGLFFITALNPKRQALTLGLAVVLLVSGGLAAYLVFPDEVEQYATMFDEALVLAGLSQPVANEVNIRDYEMQVALENIAKSPIIGNGRVSKEWVEGGFDHFFGFFYPSDVGVPGQLFIYGFLGGFILYGQFLLAAVYVFRTRYLRRNVFFVALKFFILALALDALTNGYITMYAAQTITALMLIFYFYQKDRVIAHQLAEDKKLAHASR